MTKRSPGIGVHLELGRRRNLIFNFFNVLYGNDNYIVLKNALKLYNFHMCYMLKTYKRCTLTPERPRPFFGPFLKFGQAIVEAIFVQKISNFQ
jgi:hypothetical protein